MIPEALVLRTRTERLILVETQILLLVVETLDLRIVLKAILKSLQGILLIFVAYQVVCLL